MKLVVLICVSTPCNSRCIKWFSKVCGPAPPLTGIARAGAPGSATMTAPLCAPFGLSQLELPVLVILPKSYPSLSLVCLGPCTFLSSVFVLDTLLYRNLSVLLSSFCNTGIVTKYLSSPVRFVFQEHVMSSMRYRFWISSMITGLRASKSSGRWTYKLAF